MKPRFESHNGQEVTSSYRLGGWWLQWATPLESFWEAYHGFTQALCVKMGIRNSSDANMKSQSNLISNIWEIWLNYRVEYTCSHVPPILYFSGNLLEFPVFIMESLPSVSVLTNSNWWSTLKVKWNSILFISDKEVRYTYTLACVVNM